MPYAVKLSASPVPDVYTHIVMIKNGAPAEKPRPITPSVFAMSEACVMNRSMAIAPPLFTYRGSRNNFRTVGKAKRLAAEIKALSANTRLTAASGQPRAREVYCGRRTSMRTARPLRR